VAETHENGSGTPKEIECTPLETVTRHLVKAVTEVASVCVCVCLCVCV
jgi:hypothetical protein